MGLRVDMAGTLLLMVLTACICAQAALLKKSSAVDFLDHGRREQRSAEDSDGGSDSEAEELLEAHSDYEIFTVQLNGGSQPGGNSSPDSEAVKEEGSGM
ncbi:hypothetical protein AAFF_G00235190 [Aldrovandia affinis]|uniref:Uncharacterized protein n=1 Tax=Aldrovandia affinis TaxID=143900 RepID=A0AAD7SV45_9TELE|nr:hypothetical protein AAFF_G00235190 [Aldrovandia affinis]